MNPWSSDIKGQGINIIPSRGCSGGCRRGGVQEGFTMKNEPQNEFYRPDIFGFQGKAMNKEIEIEKNLRACLVLREEFPMSIPFIQESSQEDHYLLKAKVQSYLAPGRFVLGLPKDTKVIGSLAFNKYLAKSIKQLIYTKKMNSINNSVK
jgi:hypothetical protein